MTIYSMNRLSECGRRLLGALFVGALLLASACTNADLYGVDVTKSIPNKITLWGQACTDSPIQRDLPVKVVLVMDGSNISAGLPGIGGRINGARSQAAQNAIERYPLSRNYSFALVRYAGTTLTYTEDRFSTDVSVLSTGALRYAEPCMGDGVDCNSRNYDLAFSRAASIITGDLTRSTPGERARTTYAVIFYADGPHLETGCDLPSACLQDTDCTGGQACRASTGECCSLRPMQPNNCTGCIIDTGSGPNCDEGCFMERKVRDLRNFVLDHGGAGLLLHTAHYQNPVLTVPPQCTPPTNTDDPEQCRAFETLERMAAAGTGAYTVTTEPELLNLTHFDLRSTKNVFIKKSLLAVNLNARPVGDTLKVDSDIDGIPDDEETIGGCPDPYKKDTDGDGLGDGLERSLTSQGLDPCVATVVPTCANFPVDQDLDSDLLTDCEEILLHTEPTLFDSDADGYPDLVEFLYGTNYLQPDAQRDDDYDGVTNATELSEHTDPRSNDARTRSELAYLYRLVNLGVAPILIIQKTRMITGVTVDSITPRVAPGPSVLLFQPGSPPMLAWQDSLDPNNFGPLVPIEGDGQYVLQSGTSVPGDPNQERALTVTVVFQLLPPNQITETLQIRETEHECTDFRIRNITLVHARPGQPNEGVNEILTYFSEVPSLSPDSPGIFRVARTPVTYIPPSFKDPDVADLKVEDYQFVLFE